MPDPVDHSDAAVLLNDLAFARPGDKGNDSDITVFARSEAAYGHLVGVLTPERVKSLYGDLVQGGVQRWEVPKVWALKFVMQDALGGGGPRSLRADNLGKALAGAVLRMPLQLSRQQAQALTDGSGPVHPPADPYAAQGWRVGD